jgi:glycosyltransferase involved in cell wall biosynthesis
VALVSVVVASRNYGRFLRDALESVVAQTYEAIELVVVDYGSTDDTLGIVAEYPQAISLSVPYRSLGSARNDGFHASHGGFLLFLDADDKLLPDAVATFVSCLEANPECAFAYGHQQFFEETGLLPHRGGGPEGCLGEEDPYRWMLRGNTPLRAPGAVVYRRDILESVGGYATDLEGCEDIDLNMRLARVHPICCNDRVVLMTRVHDINMTRQRGRMLGKAVAAQKRQRRYVAEHPAYANDYEHGLRLARSYWGGHLVSETIALVKAASFRNAARNMATLARWHPRGSIDVGVGLAAHGLSRVAQLARKKQN